MTRRLKNFKRLRRNIDVAPLLDEVMHHADLWDRDTSRQDQLAIHGQTRAFMLWCYTEPASADKLFRESFPGAFTYVGRRRDNVATKFPRTCHFVEQVARRSLGLLGRVAIVSLKPRGKVERHVDDGMYYKLRSRFHLVLKSPNGSRFVSGDEQTLMHEGELWWLNNRLPHEAYNDSDQDRIHLIFDILSPASFVASAGRSLRFRGQRVLAKIRRAT